jgi:hypothetical protein
MSLLFPYSTQAGNRVDAVAELLTDTTTPPSFPRRRESSAAQRDARLALPGLHWSLAACARGGCDKAIE